MSCHHRLLDSTAVVEVDIHSSAGAVADNYCLAGSNWRSTWWRVSCEETDMERETETYVMACSLRLSQTDEFEVRRRRKAEKRYKRGSRSGDTRCVVLVLKLGR